MARVSRILITGEATAYHVVSRTALDEYPIRGVDKDFGVLSAKKPLARYRRFLYEAGAIETDKGPAIRDHIVEAERKKEFKIDPTRRFLYRTRYFTDSGIIGTKQYMQTIYQQAK